MNKREGVKSGLAAITAARCKHSDRVIPALHDYILVPCTTDDYVNNTFHVKQCHEEITTSRVTAICLKKHLLDCIIRVHSVSRLCIGPKHCCTGH